MSNEFDDIKNQWKEARKNIPGKPKDTLQIISQAESQKKRALYHQYGNIAVLTAVLIMVILFFYYLFPFQELLSRFGIAFMIGGLAFRIAVEIYSTLKSRQINFSEAAVRASANTLEYYNFRKQVNGTITITLVAVYVIGVSFLTPEFLKYIRLQWMILYDSMFVIAGVILIWQIRKGIKREMKNLEDVVKLHQELEGPQ
jgi:hypothetical protein